MKLLYDLVWSMKGPRKKMPKWHRDTTLTLKFLSDSITWHNVLSTFERYDRVLHDFVNIELLYFPLMDQL